MPIIELTGDLFDSDTSLAHCVSKDFKMGAGIAVQFKKRYGQVEELVGQDKKVGECAFIEHNDIHIFYLITKEKYWHKPTYDTLESALEDMHKICIEKNITQLSIPKIGCGLDKLEWSEVKNIIDKIFTKVLVTVYSLT